ncbi:ribosomal maturation YjgA family protein [Spirosoma rhododendri]|uniref:DUF2809 domain-containing protein n=1 Tax=Spirosoma rhododendri TaxID=2728024 RepID=A0A7L5DLX3_9BACT|nr:DUF2809 domain-containing protein [Spirosoma rhododendri]QJD77438.1 DUF2809 domain-containing protein [Spirosoma rhododendri]
MPSPILLRNRLTYGALAIATLLTGFASRRLLGNYSFVRLYVGDSLWALMVFFGIAFLFPRRSTRTVALVALLFCFGIELSQLYHAPWIDRVRATTLGGLVLGFSFVWSDLICYTVGVVVGAAIDGWFVRRRLG